jgi:Cu2+-exporting ATPase
MICNAGLGAFYQRDDRSLPTVKDTAVERFSDGDLVRHLVPDGDFCRIDILVGGISCPSCIWLLERMIGLIDGVRDVSISYAGGIASVQFEPERCTPSTLFSAIADLGFVPRPYSAALSQQLAKCERDDLLLRLGTALFLTMQLMAYSYSLYAGYFQGMGAGIRNILQYASLCVATPVVFYCGWPFLSGAWQSLASRRPGMDLLIAMGALTAWVYSSWAVYAGLETYFDSAAMIITFVLLGRLLELSVGRSAMSGIEALYAAVPHHATLLNGTVSSQVAVDDVRPGDMLLVRQGESFPVDSIVVSGETEVDQALVTGESIPVLVKPGMEVRAGSINSASPVTVQAIRPAGQSFLMRVAALVQMAQSGKPSLQRLADRVSGWFVPAVIILAILVFLWRFFLTGEGPGSAMMVALSVMLIACPCAMGLAVPAAVLAACSRSAALGIILRSGNVIERLAGIDTVFFDKTGTITMGRPQVVACSPAATVSEEFFLSIIATIEHSAAHPIARSIVEYAAEQGILPGGCQDFSIIPGRGVAGSVDGNRVVCGNAVFMEEQGIIRTDSDETSDISATSVFVAHAGSYLGTIQLFDQVRTGAAVLVSTLFDRGIDQRLISGDTQQVVDLTALEVGIKAAQGCMTPDQKLDLVRKSQEHGRKVLMVGDGVNDAPALAAAHVSCSLTGSSDIALENADIIITGDDLTRLSTAHRIACKTMTVIKQNLAWAFVYNLVGIPLAISGMLTPIYAAVAMTASSLLVSLNSLRLMRIRHNG